jgi:hypothetical protein
MTNLVALVSTEEALDAVHAQISPASALLLARADASVGQLKLGMTTCILQDALKVAYHHIAT